MKKTTILATTLTLCAAVALLAGCLQNTGPETSQVPAGSSSLVQTSQTIPAVSTAAPTTGQTASPTVSQAVATVAATTAAAPNLVYRVLPAGQTHKIDLNSDKVLETIIYKCQDDYKGTLTLNSKVESLTGDVFLTGWFFLIDLDTRDSYLDIAIQELGSNDDYLVTFYYYNGSKLVKRGTVPGMICDPYSLAIDKDPFGLGTIHPDGLGNLVAITRGAILHTWFFDQPWTIGSDNLLKKVDQAYYPMNSNDPVTGKLYHETAVTLKKDLALVAQPGSSQVSLTVKTGQKASLVQCDNREWIQLRTSGGDLGWFRVVEFWQIKIGGVLYFSDDVFDGLTFAD